MDFIAIHAASKPDAACLIEGERAWTWAEFLDRRNRLAHSLAGLGLSAGEKVVVYAHNSLEALLAPAGARALGAVPVPMTHRLVAEEVAYILDHSDGVIAFADDSFIPVVEQVRPGALKVRHWILMGEARRPWALHLDDLMERGSPDTPAAAASAAFGGSMIYTGGTTGKPKGALRGAVNPTVLLGFMQALDLADPSHVHLVAGPMYHSAPGGFALFTHMLGGSVVVMPRFDPEQALWTIERHRCTSTFMAPTLIKRIVDLPERVRRRYDVSSMRVLVVAAAPCPMRVKEEAMRYFGPVLYEFYGSTELSINTILRPEDVLRKPGSCGRAAPGVEVAILDDAGRPVPTGQPGELHVRRYAGMFDGYYKDAEATRETERGDWVSVGDVAYVDAEGFVYICDRKRDMIISGGVNIYPAEIEDVLHRHPAIQDVAVFGVPDEEWGERVHAAVQPRPGESLGAAEVIAFARQHMADYKVPREVSLHADFPRDAAGKLIKRELRDPYWAGRPSRI
ncbi:MAG: AMP-binding protein [Candidatus Rokubacteria bacterium]|nr:AMP-binding protein [Candidatus Rokubacteria bacterium]